MRNFIVFLAVMTVGGCFSGAPNDGSQPVAGKLTSGGQPLQVAGREIGVGLVEVKFYPQDANGKIGETHYQAGVDAQGNFRVPGPSNRGLPPGKYRIIVRQWDPYPQTDKLNGKFDETNSKIVREITTATTLDLDLAQLEKSS
jgi:hypothetical protein